MSVESIGDGEDERQRDAGDGVSGDDSTQESGPGEERGNAGEGPNETDQQQGEQTDSTTDSVPVSTETYTARFTGFVLLFGVLTAIGIATFHPGAIAAAGLLLVFLLAGVATTPTAPGTHLNVTYDVKPPHPRPSDTVVVTVTIENTGDTTFTDIRMIDGVPDDLEVITGSPRTAGPLQPGDTLTIMYGVTARRGAYTFGPVTARTRTLLGSMWVQETLTVDTPGSFQCAVEIDDIPLEDRTAHLIGELLSNDGGEGIEFHSTREYHRGDSPSRINWRELAKRGELNTITYKEHQAAEIALIVDARSWNTVSAGNGSPTATELSAYAAYQLTATLTGAGHYVGVTVPGLQPTESRQSGNAFPYRFLEPTRSKDQQRHVFELLEEIETSIRTTSIDPADATPLRDPGTPAVTETTDADTVFDIDPFHITTGQFAHDLSAWSTATTQFVFITPLLDRGSQSLCTQLQNMGFPMVVISPDVTTPTTPQATNNTDSDIPMRSVKLQRATRIESLRQRGITVIDWTPTTPLSVCCEKQTPKGA